MPEVEEDLNDGFKLVERDGELTLTRVFFCKDLEGADAVTKFSQALQLTADDDAPAHTGGDVPSEFDSITIGGKTLYVQSRELTPWPPADAQVSVVYSGRPRAFNEAGFSPTLWECGATNEQNETDFDAENLALDFAERTPITVPYTDPDDGVQDPQNARVPIVTCKSTWVATRQEDSDPTSRADTFVSKVNATEWRENPPGTVMCTSIVGRSSGNGIWTVTYEFAYSPTGFTQIARWIDPTTGLAPALTSDDLASGNGAIEVVVQGEEEFNDLNL